MGAVITPTISKVVIKLETAIKLPGIDRGAPAVHGLPDGRAPNCVVGQPGNLAKSVIRVNNPTTFTKPLRNLIGKILMIPPLTCRFQRI